MRYSTIRVFNSAVEQIVPAVCHQCSFACLNDIAVPCLACMPWFVSKEFLYSLDNAPLQKCNFLSILCRFLDKGGPVVCNDLKQVSQIISRVRFFLKKKFIIIASHIIKKFILRCKVVNTWVL